jgi:hypothetical protein
MITEPCQESWGVGPARFWFRQLETLGFRSDRPETAAKEIAGISFAATLYCNVRILPMSIT